MSVDTSITRPAEGVKCSQCQGRAYYVIAGKAQCWLHKDWAFDQVLCAALKEGYHDRANALARVRLKELNAL